MNYNWRTLDFLDIITALPYKTHPYGWFPHFIGNNSFWITHSVLKFALLWQMISSVKLKELSVSLIKQWKPY